MTEIEEHLIKLRDDKLYYGEFGKRYLSNSDIGTLFENPKLYKQDTETTKPMIMGSYFHLALLEPEKLSDFEIVECSTRNTNIYKDAIASSDSEIILLGKEVDEINRWVGAIKSNLVIYQMIYDAANEYEKPAIGYIMGTMWKGKTDIETPTNVLDLKTSASIKEFSYSAKKYNYDSQSFIYKELFGKRMRFIVIDKETYNIGLFDCSDDFLERGRAKVERAIAIRDRFYGENATENVNNYIFKGEL
jgi:hypothetical protein